MKPGLPESPEKVTPAHVRSVLDRYELEMWELDEKFLQSHRMRKLMDGGAGNVPDDVSDVDDLSGVADKGPFLRYAREVVKCRKRHDAASRIVFDRLWQDHKLRMAAENAK